MTTTAVVVPAAPAATDDPVVAARRLSRVGIAALLASTRAAREAIGADDPAGRTADIGLGSVALARETTLAARPAKRSSTRRSTHTTRWSGGMSGEPRTSTARWPTTIRTTP